MVQQRSSHNALQSRRLMSCMIEPPGRLRRASIRCSVDEHADWWTTLKPSIPPTRRHQFAATRLDKLSMLPPEQNEHLVPGRPSPSDSLPLLPGGIPKFSECVADISPRSAKYREPPTMSPRCCIIFPGKTPLNDAVS